MTEVARDGSSSSLRLAKYLAQVAVVTAAYFIAGKLGQAPANIRSSNLGPFWPASGIALAALLAWGYQMVPGIFVGAFLIGLSSPVSAVAVAGQSLGAAFGALTAAYILRQFLHFNPSFSRLVDAIGLIVFGACSGALVSASVGVFALYRTHVHPYAGLGSAWLIYWLGDGAGVLLITPVVLTLPTLYHIRKNRFLELASMFTLLIATCFVIFGDFSVISAGLHVLAFAVLPFVMWAAIRFGVSGAAVSVLVIAAIATVETALGRGPFAGGTAFKNAVLLDVFFTVLSLTGLMLAATILEREQAERERERLVREKATSEARLRLAAIIESSDDSVIGTDLNGIVTDWNRGAELLYGYSETEALGRPLSFLVPSDCSDDLKSMMESVIDERIVKRYEAVRQKKDGSRVDISVTVSPIIDSKGRVIGTSGISRDITDRKKQDDILRESEARFRVVSDSAPVLIWMSGIDKGRTYFNKPWLSFTGRSLEKELGNGWAESVHPDDAQACLNGYSRAFEGLRRFDCEYRLRRYDGEYRWIADTGVPRFHANGSFAGYIGSCSDITDRRRAEEVVAGLNRKLFEAQEQERTRIARELHDDINQRLALISLQLAQILKDPPATQFAFKYRLHGLQDDISELSIDVQSLAHRLHPAKLEYLGAVAAMKSLCREFSGSQHIDVEFDADEMSTPLPSDVSLCLFRVLQESLQNVSKHSRATRVQVELRGSRSEVNLSVRDFGTGFNIEQAIMTPGLGLASMHERVKIINGNLTIRSSPEKGTTIHVRVPLTVKTDSVQAAS